MNRKTRRRLLAWLSRIPGAYSALAFLVARRVTVKGWSMAPTLRPGERLLFDRLAYQRNPPRRGDIVLVSHTQRPNLRIIKRVTHLPGDVTPTGQTLARGEYWLEGDNPGASTDSRTLGAIPRANLLARAWLRYHPTRDWRTFN